MKCAVHSEVDAVGFCRNCGKPMCATCVRPVRDVLYCEDCLATIMGIPGAQPASDLTGLSPAASAPPPAPGPGRSTSNPGLAFILGFIFPGLGAVYNGQYNKALIQILVFASIVVGLASDIDDSLKPALGIGLAGFIFYMAFDAHRTARAKLAGEVPADPIESWSKDRPIGPIILIAVGALFLLNNWFPLFWIGRLWPLILIGVGILLFRKRLGSRS